LKVNPPKEGPFHSKQGSFEFQVYIYMYTYIKKPVRYLELAIKKGLATATAAV